VIVLGSRRDRHPATSPDGTDARPASGRAPPPRKRRSSRSEVLKARRRLAPSPNASTINDPVVVDNFGKTMRVTKAELRVFETYFSDILDELFGSLKTGSERDEA
jgi:hypothetical protein